MTHNEATHWHAVYTASRCEKKVRERLMQQGIDCFLPVQTVLRQWKYRKKRVEIPIISGTIFVRISTTQYLTVLQTQGVVSFLKLRGEQQPAIIPDNQMETFRFLIENAEECVELINENLSVGDYVSVIKGPLKGLEGELVSFNGCSKILIRIDSMGCALANIPTTFVESHSPTL